MPQIIEISPAELRQDLPLVRELFREYAEGLGIDLGFQNFEAELSTLPGKYAPHAGRLLLAWRDAEAVDCVALRPMQDGACEMKRLYVRPRMRGEHLGKKLAERICREAREAGYSRICLDTLSSLTPAVKLYTSMGFSPTEPYVFNPVPGVMFLQLAL